MKAENEEIKISSYGLHEMEESATQISIKGEEEMSRELIGEGLEFIGINEWSNLLTNGINMNDIALKYVQLLAADHVSELMINQLRLDGIYTIQNSPVYTCQYSAGINRDWCWQCSESGAGASVR